MLWRPSPTTTSSRTEKVKSLSNTKRKIVGIRQRAIVQVIEMEFLWNQNRLPLIQFSRKHYTWCRPVSLFFNNWCRVISLMLVSNYTVLQFLYCWAVKHYAHYANNIVNYFYTWFRHYFSMFLTTVDFVGCLC